MPAGRSATPSTRCSAPPDGRVRVVERRPDPRHRRRRRDPRRIDEGALDAAPAEVDASPAPVRGADLGRDRDPPVDRRLSDAHRQAPSTPRSSTRRTSTSETIQHVFLSGISFAIVAAIGVPVGVLIAQAGNAVRIPVFLLANLGQAVPGIGCSCCSSRFFGLGVTPTVIALVVYGLLPVLRNTVAGIQGVDPSAVDAARGMGMTRWQALMRVQLPLASPLVFAGLRTSLVLIIGTATLGNFIGGGGLGDVIAAGINNSDRMVFVGAVMVASLALLADWGLSMIERVAVPRQVSQRSHMRRNTSMRRKATRGHRNRDTRDPCCMRGWKLRRRQCDNQRGHDGDLPDRHADQRQWRDALHRQQGFRRRAVDGADDGRRARCTRLHDHRYVQCRGQG